MRTIVLISCVSKKLPYKARARHLYTSPLFRLSLAYAQTLNPDDVFILSARHGLLSLDTIVEPYDSTLNDFDTKRIRQWAEHVLQQLRQEVNLGQDHFIILAGERYRRYLIPHIRFYEIPLKGLPIGKQLSWLKERTEK
jgi:hypothetical protein